MPIGTNITVVHLKINAQPKRIPNQSSNNLILEIFKFVGIQIIGALLAKFTGGLSLKFALNLGLTNFTSQVISSTLKVATEFTLIEIYDHYKEQATWLSRVLNLLPAVAEVGKITRAYKVTKFLKLAKDSKIINELGISSVNNLENLIGQITGQKILTKNKLFFDYSKKPSKETVLHNLGFIARKNFNQSYKAGNIYRASQLLEIEHILQKINPKLVQKTFIVEETWANKFLQRFNTNINDVSRMPTENWLELITKMQKLGVKKGTILALNATRANVIYNWKIFKTVTEFMRSAQNIAKMVTPEYWIQKAIGTVLAPFRNFFMELEKTIKKKISQWIDFQKIIAKVRNKIIKDGILLPLYSKTFFMVRAKPIGTLNDVALTIYYWNPNYPPIGTIITTTIKLQQFITAPSPFRYYMYESGWSVGWGTTKGQNMKLLNLLPPAVQHFTFESLKLYRLIVPILNSVKKSYDNRFSISKDWKDKTLVWTVNSIYGKGFVTKNMKKYVNKSRKINFKNELKKTFHKKTATEFKKINKKLNKKW